MYDVKVKKKESTLLSLDKFKLRIHIIHDHKLSWPQANDLNLFQ